MAGKTAALTFGERCRNILSANWRAHLNTIKADAKGSKGDIHSSKVHYMFKTGKPYLWVHEGDLHNMNTILDERGSLAVISAVPGPLMSLLKSIEKLHGEDGYLKRNVAVMLTNKTLKYPKQTCFHCRGHIECGFPQPINRSIASTWLCKIHLFSLLPLQLPARVALAGDVIPLKDDKAQLITSSLEESVLLEHRTVSKGSYAVSGILSSSSDGCRSRSESFQEILNHTSNYLVYKFNIRSCTYVDGGGSSHDIGLTDVDAPKADLLLPFSEKLIDGINQSQARRRALMLFCLEHYNAKVRDAVMLSIDKRGFDVLGKVPNRLTSTGSAQQYVWKEFRFTFKEEASDVEAFCHLLVGLEEEILQSVKSYSGLG